MHEMGFTKHECCTSVHFSGMISIRLETCKPFSSSKPQMQYSRVHSTHTHMKKPTHRPSATNSDDRDPNNASRFDAVYLFVWQSVVQICKYRPFCIPKWAGSV